MEKQIKNLTVLGCRKLTYYIDNEPKINTLSETLTLKISSETLRSSYLFGFNGQEKDDEIKGDGNSYDFGARIIDTRIGRWLAVDPLASSYCWNSPYAEMSNDPINKIDPDGMGDYYTQDGKHLGSDGRKIKDDKGAEVPDNKVYVTTEEVYNSKNNKKSDGSRDWDKIIVDNSTKTLKLTHSELLDEARWIYGEGGSKKGKKGENTPDYYAWVIKTNSKHYGGLYYAMYNTMNNFKKFMDGSYDRPSDKKQVAKHTYPFFYDAQQGGVDNLLKTIPSAQNVISSIIKVELNITKDPTGGAKGWLGGRIPNRENPDGERYSTSVRIQTIDGMYHYFHKFK